jgi:hypothetical protein
MDEILFTSNPNGKLLLDVFPDIRLFDPGRFKIDSELKANYKTKYLGTIKVLAVRHFAFKDISDSLAYFNIGHPASYQASMLQKYYINQMILTARVMLTHITFQYVERNMEVANSLLDDWWRVITEKYGGINNPDKTNKHVNG